MTKHASDVACISPDDLSTIIFCSTLAVEFEKKNNLRIFTVAPVERYASELSLIPSIHYDIPMERFISPLKDFLFFSKLFLFFRKRKIKSVITFTTKPNIYGVLAASLAGADNIILAIRGLGRVFGEQFSWKDKVINWIVSFLYKMACRRASIVWFTNENDRAYFVENGIVRNEKVLMTVNAVDLSAYSMSAINPINLKDLRNELKIDSKSTVVVMVARLIWAKGVREFAESAMMLRERLPNTHFILVAPEEKGPGSVPKAFLEKISINTKFHWLGFRKDVKDIYAISDLAVLPSYYKEGGYPRALLEPMAFGKAVIAANTDDCKAPVHDGINGYLVPVKDSAALSNAIFEIISNDEQRTSFGKESLRIVRELYDDRIVVKKILDQLD